MADSQKQRARDMYEAWAVGRSVPTWALLPWSEKNIWRNYVVKQNSVARAKREFEQAARELEGYKKSNEPS